MTDRMHHHRHRRQRLAVVEAQHLHARIVRAVRIQAHHRAAVDGLAAIDAEADAIFAVADADTVRMSARRLFRRRAELVDQLAPPIARFSTKPGPE